MKVFCAEIKRAMGSIRFGFSILLGVLLLYQPAYPFSFLGNVTFVGSSVYDAIQDAMGLGVFILCGALICTLPYGDAHAVEVESGAFPYLLFRVGTKRYIGSKIAATILSGGTALSASFLIFCLIQSLAFSPLPFLWEDWTPVFSETLCLFEFGGCWALSSLAMSVWVANPFAALALPICITRLSWILRAFTGIELLYTNIVISPNMTHYPPIWQLCLQQALLYALFIGLICVGVRRKKC